MKTSNIIIRVSDLEKQKIKEAADKLQMSMSEYILYLFRKEPQKWGSKFLRIFYASDTKILVSKF